MTDTATSFNPLEVARDLKAAGIEAGQAEAIADAMRKAATADHADLATRADLAATRAEIAALRVEIRIIGALVLAIAAKLFGIFDAVAGVLS